ncbi:9598_t:CDS:2, partial [Funneliformis geosporum]
TGIMSLSSTSQSYGQNETLISSIRNIIKDYPCQSILKEFLQNADDAGASRFHVIIDGRSHPTKALLCDEMKAWQGPAILIFNNAMFKTTDFDSLMQIRVGGKQGDDTKIGKHGLGFNSCYHFTDVPSFISGDSIAFLDPQEKFLPRRHGVTQRGIIGPFPKNGIGGYSEKDQLVPYEGIEGIDFLSTFQGTLFRIPLRKQPSDISDSIFTTDQIFELFTSLKSTISSQFLFLRSIETIEISHIPKEKAPNQLNPLYKAIITGLTENLRNQRKCVMNNKIQAFQMDIEQIENHKIVQKDSWIIATGAQPNPEDSQLNKYSERYRLRILGGIASLHKSSKNDNNRNDIGLGANFPYFKMKSKSDNTFNECQSAIGLEATFASRETKSCKKKTKSDNIFNECQSFVGLGAIFANHEIKSCKKINKSDYISKEYQSIIGFEASFANHEKKSSKQKSKSDNIFNEFQSDIGLESNFANREKKSCQKKSLSVNIFNEYRSDFIGRLYSFLSLPDTTSLPFHLNGTWAQGSDRGRLLMEKDNSPDIDRQKLNWNRHILLDFLPKLYCKLIKKAIELKERENGEGIESNEYREKIHPISKFWPFPIQNNSKYVIEFGFKVLEFIIQKEDLFAGSIENRVNSLFELLSSEQIVQLRNFLKIAWAEIATPNFKSLVCYFPIWKVLSNPLDENSKSVPLKPATCGYILERNIKQYQIKTSNIYLDALGRLNRLILTELNVPKRTIYEYTFEDVEFPKEYDSSYLDFLKDILKDNRIVQNLKDRRCFPNSITKELKKISDLYDNSNLVFRTVFGGESSVFLHPEFSNSLNLESIEGIPFIPITKNLGNPYNLHYKHPQALDCLNNVILPAYREVAWSKMPLIADDVIPPQQVLEKYPSFGKPGISIVISHLRFLYSVLRNDKVWKKNWTDVFRNNIYEVYKWLDVECSSNEGLDLSEYICSEPLFLNYNRNQDPFNLENWVTSADLILNSEYVHPDLARYPTMLKSAGAREIRRPNVQINVRNHDQSRHNQSTLFKFLFDQTPSLNDVNFIVNGHNIKASRYILAASSEIFRQKFISEETSPINPVTITIGDIEPNSMHILLRYLYGQNIDEAIQNRLSLNDNVDLSFEPNTDESQDLVLYKDLLKLSDDYKLDHLKELIELRLSRLVRMSNVDVMKRFAEISNASQLNEYCQHFNRENSGVKT